MRARLIVAGISALLFAASGMANATPIEYGTYDRFTRGACLEWVDSAGATTTTAKLCGLEVTEGTRSERSVNLSRTAVTCDPGTSCYLRYLDDYSQPATPEEFSINVVAGTAKFDKVLTREGSPDCAVQAFAEATPATPTYPTVMGAVSTNPDYPSAVFYVDRSWNGVIVATNPRSARSDAFHHRDASTHRAAIGSGSVCSWINNRAADEAGMGESSWSDASVAVVPGPPGV